MSMTINEWNIIMTSPNASGCVSKVSFFKIYFLISLYIYLALLVSALEHEEIEYSPSLVRHALMNTPQKSDDKFSVGADLIQIHKALDHYLNHH